MTQTKPIPLRKQQKNYTRQRLIQVARELFVKNGTQATGIDDIAKAAGTSRATVYTHFGGKQDIIRELVSEMWDTAQTLCEGFGALKEWSDASIGGWLKQIFDSWEEYAESTKVVLREMPAEVTTEAQSRLEAQVEALMRSPEMWQHFSQEEGRRRAYLLLVQLYRCLSAWHYGGWVTERDPLLRTLTDIWTATLHAKH
jgi:AcrR family transcriptional regulator